MSDPALSLSFLGWIEAHPGTAYWVQATGTIVAALIALVAAALAFKGAHAQANAVFEAQQTVLNEDRKAIAAAFWAELIDVQAAISATILRLQNINGPPLMYIYVPHPTRDLG
ncbi:hypothetical protein [Aurantimonas coralicida]|uniref:hypothetical protein n=1 Tax=Aurantimonas coralicida TaxID=182270 RepID=UPI0023A29607|nr:hypothetical protein [Aurantimonas coralicida]MDE0922096.1 hypothetical protein [Aurantimonas coralicida]